MKHTFKRLTAIFLTLSMLLSVLPLSVFAASDPANYVFDIAEGTIQILDGDTAGKIKVAYGGGLTTEEFDPSQVITVTGSYVAAKGGACKGLKVETNLPVAVRIRDLTIDNALARTSVGSYGAAMALVGNALGKANVTLTLEGTSYLGSFVSRSGIEVEEGHSLTIQGDGVLTAQGGGGAAGIGGSNGENGGIITINGGTVTATGGEDAAGIGGGQNIEGIGGSNGEYGGTITINGGMVTATGGECGAGIGGGHRGNGGAVTINGGTIFAYGGDYSAGIGGGYTQLGDKDLGNGGTITITGGTVTAYGGGAGAGIGGGRPGDTTCGNGGVITISGGTVTAYGNAAAGIGGGGAVKSGTGNGGEVTITGGTVTAIGYTYAHDIGGGAAELSEPGSLTVDGDGWVTAAKIGGTPTLTKGVVNGTVYGSVTLTEDRTVDDLTILAGASLTIPEGLTLTVNGTVNNSGTLTVFDESSLAGEGSLAGDGSFVTKTPKITVASDLVETGEALDPGATLDGFSFGGKAFTVDATGWTGPVYDPAEVKDAGEYTVSFTNGHDTVSRTFTVDCELNFAEGEMGSTLRVTYNTVLGEVPASDREGYTFDGWFTEGGEAYDPTAPVIHSATYYACYTPNDYEVTYGEETMTVTFGQPFTVPEATGIGENQTFYAWFGSDGNIYLAGETYLYTLAGDLELTPLVDTDTKYWTVNFIGEDGYLYRTELVEQTGDATVELPAYAPYPEATWICGNDEYAAGEIVPVSGDMTFTLNVPAQYTVTFKANGYLVAQYTVRGGQTLPEIPAVPEVYGYTGKWSPAVTTATVVTQDMTVTAEYKAVTCYIQYRLTEDQNTTVTSQAVDFNKYFTPVAYKWDVPDGQSFLAWRGKDGNLYVPGLYYLMKNTNPLVVTPLFENNTEYWTVKFVGENGYLYDVVFVEKTSDAEVILPTYAEYPDATWWLLDSTDALVEYNAGDSVEITGNTTFIINAPATYTVTFVANGYEVAQYTLRDGETLPEIPEVPEKYGYTGQWDTDLTGTAITGNLTVTAVYTANEYTIYYQDENGDVYSEEDVTFGDWFTPAEFDGTAPNGTKFLGWNGADGQFFQAGQRHRLSVASDLYLVPVFAADTEYWTVKFCHPDGSLDNIYLVKQAAEEGTEFFMDDKEYSLYPDAKWELTSGIVDDVAVGDLVSTTYITVRSDVVFTAVVPDTYTILFFSEEGYLMDARFVMENELIGPAPDAPAKEGYTFVGWQDENGELLADDTVATQDAAYRPVYEANKYPITLVPSDHVTLGVLPESAEASVGDVITIGALAEAGYETYYVCVYYQNATGTMVPVAITPLPANAPYDNPDMNGYTFVMPAGAVTVQVVEQANRNTVKFVVDGTTVGFEYILSGETPEAPADPVKEGYTFVGWLAESTGKTYAVGEAFDPIYADETYSALFEINTYDLTYYRGTEADESEYKCILALPDGTFVEFFNNDTMDMPTYVLHDVTYNDTVILAEPMLPGYVFKGWVDESGYMHPAGAKYTMPAADTLLTAVWEVNQELSCLVRFVDGGKLYDAFLAYDGQDASIPATDPVVAGKTFLGWQYGNNTYSNSGVKDFVVIASDTREMTFEAVWEDELYTVTYVGYDTIENVPYGAELVTLEAPEQEGSTFVAWQDTETGAYYFANTAFTVTGDKTFEAVWAENDVEYVVKFFDENGNLIDLFVAEEGAELTAPVYEQGREDAEYVWVDAEHNTYLTEGESFTVTADQNFRATLIDEAKYPVRIYVDSDSDDLDNVATASKSEYLLGETVHVRISVPEGYVLKRVSAAGINGDLLPLKDSLLPMGSEEYLYIFEMPAAEVGVLVELEKIPVGCTIVKFLNNGDLYDYVVVEKGSNATAPETAPSMDGYSFIEWRSGDSYVAPGSTFAVPADAPDVIVYNAIYEAEKYVVHYNMNGGLNASGEDYEDVAPVTYNQVITLADVAYLDGYVFIGWRDDATGILYGAKGTYVVKGDASFTAVWEAAEYIVRFIDPNTGIIYGYEPAAEGQQVLAPAAPVVVGKTFTHWENKDDATDKVLASSLTPNILADTTYYAMYEVSQHNIAVVTDQCSVNLNVAGAVDVGTAVQFTVTANEGCAVESVVLTYIDGLSPVVRELYPASNGVYTFIMPDADVTITAKAVQNVFSVFTNSDANSQITLSSNKAEADSVVTFTVDVNEGYTLKEVYVLGASGKPVALSIVDGVYTFVMPREDVTITTTSVKAEFSVTYLDSDNTLLAIVPVASGEYATAPVASKEGYSFDHWEILPLTDPVKTFNPETDEVKADLVVRAVYVGDTFTVQAGLVDNVHALNAECTVSSGNTNSSNLLQNALNAEAGKTVTFVVAANYDWMITGVAIVGLDGSKTVIEPTLRLKETVDGINYYTVTFTMPAENVKIDVYTVAKLFRVDVVENIPAAGDYTINGFYSNNLLVAQGELVTIDIAPIPGYEVVDVIGTFFDGVSEVSLVDCTLNADKTQFTFPMVAKDVHVEIIYAPIGYNVDVQTSNFQTYKPKADVNPAVVVESLDPELTSQGRIELLPLELENYTNSEGQIYTIPANGVAIVGDRISFRVIEYTGYDLDTVTVTYDNGECTCPLTVKDGIYYFDMPADSVVITAVFKPETYTVTKDTASEAHGQVELNSCIENSISADYKEIVTVDVTPDDGYQVSKIYYVLDDTSVMDFDAASYTNTTVMADVLDGEHSISFHMPASDVKVYVEYIAIDYTVNVVTEEATVTGYATPSNVGDQVTFHVEANYGYTISKVYVVNDTTGARVDRFTDDINGTYGADYYFTMPASSVTIHVETVKDIYNVEYRDNGDLIGGEQIPYQETAHVTDFTPLVDEGRPGYHFVGWISAQTETPVTVPSNSNDDFVIVRDTTIVAAYEKDEIDVHFLPTTNGTVTELSTGNTAEYVLDTTVFGDTVKFTAEPDEGYAIDTVRVYTTNSDGYVMDLYCAVSGNEYTFVIPATFKADIHDVQAADVNVSVTFTKDTFTLTRAEDCGTNGTIAVNGTVSTETSFHYLYQEQVTITATPDAGYYVVSVTAENADGSVKYEVTGTKPAVDTPAGDPLTLTFNMPACDLTYTVVYAKCDYSITYVFDSAKGSVTSAPVDLAQIDDVVTVTVTPAEGYRLDTLTVTYEGGEKSCVLTQISENVYTFTMPAEAVTVTATFTEITYTAYLTVEGEGDAMLNGYYTVNMPADYLETVTIDTLPASGWELASILVDGGAITVNEEIKAEGGAYTFTMPAHDVNIVVTFVKTGYGMTAYSLNFFEEGHGTVTLDPKDTAYVGDCIVITADPDDGYRVANVVVLDDYGYAVPVSKVNGDAGYVETWRFTMPASNVSIYVTFEVYGSSYYTDVRTDFWFFDAVTFVTDRGYFYGVGDGLFGPFINMDRAMFVTVLGRMAGVDKNTPYTGEFPDVEADSYYAPYVAWAAENGIIVGRDDGTFDPYTDINREEMAAVMYRFCKAQGIDMTIENEFFMDRYTDVDDVSPWAVTYVEWAVGVGLMRGMSDTTIDPLAYAERAQVAQVIKNLCDKVLYQ